MSQIQTETNLVSQFLAFIIVVLNIFAFTIVFIAVIVSVQHSNQLLNLKAVLFGDHEIFSYNAYIIRSDQAFQLLEQLTIATGFLDIQGYRVG